MNKKTSEGFAVNQLIIPRFDLLSLTYDNEQLSQIKNETSRPTVQIKRRQREPSPIEDVLEPDYAVFESGDQSDLIGSTEIREIQDRLDILTNKIDSISGLWGSSSYTPSLELVITIDNDSGILGFSPDTPAQIWWDDVTTGDIINVSDIDDSYRESIIDDLKNYIIGQLGITDLTLDNIEIISIIKGSITINFNIINIDNETLVTIIEGCAASIDDCNNRASAAGATCSIPDSTTGYDNLPQSYTSDTDIPGDLSCAPGFYGNPNPSISCSSDEQEYELSGCDIVQDGSYVDSTGIVQDCPGVPVHASVYTCDSPDGSNLSVTSCSAGFNLAADGISCTPTTCTCPGGTAETGISCRASGEICSACDAGFGLDGSICTSCPAGTYSAANDNTICAPHTICGTQANGTTSRLSGESPTTAGTCDACANGTEDTGGPSCTPVTPPPAGPVTPPPAGPVTAPVTAPVPAPPSDQPRTCGDINADGTRTTYVCSNDGDYLPKWHGYPGAAVGFSCSGDNCNKDDCCLSQWQWATTALLGGRAGVHQTGNCYDACNRLGLSCDGSAAWFDSTTDAAAFNRAVDAANLAHDPNSNLVNTSGLPNATVTSDAHNMQPWCHIDGGCYAHLDDTLSNCDLNMNDHSQWFQNPPHPHQLCKCA